MTPRDGSSASADFDAFYAATSTGMVRGLVPLTGDLAEAEDGSARHRRPG